MIALHAAGVVLVSVSGWLGGELVYFSRCTPRSIVFALLFMCIMRHCTNVRDAHDSSIRVSMD
jgi:hypothetical protein